MLTNSEMELADMIRIEKACIDLMLLLKKGKCGEKELREFKERIFKIALTAVGGEGVWKEITKILDK